MANQDSAQAIMTALDALGSAEKAARAARYFKTGPGQYGEGDRFIGVTVPEQRRIAVAHIGLAHARIDTLLASPTHEHRLTGLLILVAQYAACEDEAEARRVVDFYLGRLDRANNWDLVDLSAPQILGAHLCRHPGERDVLKRLAASDILWERRVAVVATWALIKQGQTGELLALAQMLLSDPEDLMHKAVGWMLREVGKKDLGALESFLDRHGPVMPRTMLRYAIERMDADRRKHFMARR